MDDPIPENIEGSKEVVHSYEHRIDWGYVALGAGLIAIAYVLFVLVDDDDDQEEMRTDL